jgi:HSP20 family molecular chaperone IbpA
MTAMHVVGSGHRLPARARLSERNDAYVVELDVSDFTERELAVEVVGLLVTVRGDQLEMKEDNALAFHLHERLEESFRLPDDACTDGLSVFYKHGTLQILVPRTPRKPRLVPIEHAPWHLINADAEAC